MQRRHSLFLARLVPSALLTPRLLRALGHQIPRPNLREETLRLNDLAANIHTVADSRRFIDAIAELFQDNLQPAWITASFRNRLAQAEYLTITNSQRRISEQHLAETWNTYANTIGALAGSKISAVEIHSIRNSHFTTGRQMWDRGYRNFWLMPSIFATQPDGTLAPACRLVESFRILYDLDRFPENIARIRESLANKTPNPDATNQAQQKPPSNQQMHAYLEMRAATNRQQGIPYSSAEAAALRKRSVNALTNTIDSLLNSVLNT
jgi:hypothetical protein